MLANFKDLGEQTLSKIAEMAIATQLKADKLEVKVKSNPENLAKGVVDSLSIYSEGLITSSNQRLEKMNMTFNEISVNPFQALVGKINLTSPSDGQAFFELTEKNLEDWLNQVKPKTVSKINCRILPEGELVLNLLSPTRESINTIIKPRVCQVRNSILLEDIKTNTAIEEIWHQQLLKHTEAFLNLQYFQLKGFTIKICHVKFRNGNLVIQADTKITQFR